MDQDLPTAGVLPFRAGAETGAERPVYYISNRPEAYEITIEVSHDEALDIGRLIAERAAAIFPDIEFRVDGEWHMHPRGTEHVAMYIESHWREWVEAQRASPSQAA